ncbi:MAG TPA: RNA polymerase sigma factor [Polyangia bacterium]|nr:RNA polymerase sigma factor [Polyangia bacterium]
MDRKLWAEARAIADRHTRGDSEDLSQDLVVAVLEQTGEARNPAAWLERVGRNAAIDRWRAARRREELAAEIEPPAAPVDPEAALLGRERRGLVRRALAALPRPQRRAALARFHGDLPYEEVGARVGAPAITARTRVNRALAAMRARLGALRAMFVFPGVQMSALGVVFVAAASPGLPPAHALSIDEMSLSAPRAARHFARARVFAASPAPAPATRPKAAPRIVTAPAPAPDAPPPLQRMEFGDDLVEGAVVGPEGEPIVSMRPAEQPSLIEIRRQFVPEMLKTLEDY